MRQVRLILDVTSGILIAGTIIGIVILGAGLGISADNAGERSRGFFSIAVIGAVIGIAVVVCRLLRWP